VYLATGLVFPDSLAAGPVAGRAPGPVLLTGPTALPPQVAAELRRLNPAQVIIVGGPGSVSDAVIEQIHAAWR
jgi:putative cell wall-binding protein